MSFRYKEYYIQYSHLSILKSLAGKELGLTARRYVSKALPAQPTGNVSKFFRDDLSRWRSRYGASFCSHAEIILNIRSVGEESWFGFKNCQDFER